MRIRGSLKAECRLCRFYLKGKTNICELTKAETEPCGGCSRFKYDIFKYTPKDKNNFKRFSKEDFEI